MLPFNVAMNYNGEKTVNQEVKPDMINNSNDEHWSHDDGFTLLPT